MANRKIPAPHEMPTGHPPGVVWVGLLHARSRTWDFHGHRLTIRSPLMLKRSDWRYATPVPRSLVPELLDMTTWIEPPPDDKGERPSSRLIQRPLFEVTAAPPNWRQKLRDLPERVAWIEGVESEHVRVPSGSGADQIDMEALEAEVAERARQAANERWIDLAKSGSLDRKAAEAAVAAGLVDAVVLDHIPQGDPEAAAVLAMDKDLIVDTIGDSDMEMLDRLLDEESAKQKARGRGPRKYVREAIAARRAALASSSARSEDVESDVPALDP